MKKEETTLVGKSFPPNGIKCGVKDREGLGHCPIKTPCPRHPSAVETGTQEKKFAWLPVETKDHRDESIKKIIWLEYYYQEIWD